jgi:DNA-binding transcriptional ArsR family regulator
MAAGRPRDISFPPPKVRPPLFSYVSLRLRKRKLTYEKRMHPFEVMAEPIRRRIIEILASGEHPVNWIADCITMEFGVGRTATTWHLRILRECGWVEVRPEWSNRMYRLDVTAFDELDEAVHHLRKIWDRRIGTMANREPTPADTLPIAPRRSERSSFAATRGRRAKGRRHDPWTPPRE